MRSLIAIFLLTLIQTITVPDITASDMKVHITDNALYPGDIFLIEIRSSGQPSGFFNGGRIVFFRTGDDLYQAIVPVDIDIKPGHYPVIITSGGSTFKELLRVEKKTFPVKTLTLPDEKVFLSPEDEERVNRENVRLSGIWNKVTMPLWDGDFVPPLETPVTTEFGVIRVINEKKRSIHRGIDYKGKAGMPIHASNSGVVELVDDLFYGGNTVVINHGGGVFSVYMHLSKTGVFEGQRVSKGAVVGFVGSSGRATGPHLHLSIKVHGMSINPASLYSLKLSPVKL